MVSIQEAMSKGSGHVPPGPVRSAARRGLELRKKHGKGGLSTQEAGKQGIGSGVARARDLAAGNALSLATVKRMVAFFSRHEKNKSGGEDDAGYIAWQLWGGDAGRAWAKRIVAASEKVEKGADVDKLIAKIMRESGVDKSAAIAILKKQGTIRRSGAHLKMAKGCASANWLPVTHGGMHSADGLEWRWPSAEHARQAAIHHMEAYKRLCKPLTVAVEGMAPRATAIMLPGADEHLRIGTAAAKWWMANRKGAIQKGDTLADKPPSGYEPIPGSRHSGYRKRQGEGYVYWYPGGKAPAGAQSNHGTRANAIAEDVAARLKSDPSFKDSNEHARMYREYLEQVDALRNAEHDIGVTGPNGTPKAANDGQAKPEPGAEPETKPAAQQKPGPSPNVKPKPKAEPKPDAGQTKAIEATKAFHAKAAEKSRRKLEGLLRSKNPTQESIEASLSEYEHHIDAAGGHAQLVSGHEKRLSNAAVGSKLEMPGGSTWTKSGPKSYTSIGGAIYRGLTLPIRMIARLLAALTGPKVSKGGVADLVRSCIRDNVVEKGPVYYGPRGGRYADPGHTQPYKTGASGGIGESTPAGVPSRVDELATDSKLSAAILEARRAEKRGDGPEKVRKLAIAVSALRKELTAIRAARAKAGMRTGNEKRKQPIRKGDVQAIFQEAFAR